MIPGHDEGAGCVGTAAGGGGGVGIYGDLSFIDKTKLFTTCAFHLVATGDDSC